MKDEDWITVTEEFWLDINWFLQYATLANGFYLFNPIRPTLVISPAYILIRTDNIASNFALTTGKSTGQRQQ